MLSIVDDSTGGAWEVVVVTSELRDGNSGGGPVVGTRAVKSRP